MHAFGCLSNIFVLDFISSWLALKDIGRLDTSFCVKDRLFCEKCIKENNVLLPMLRQQKTSIKGNFGLLCWLVARTNVQSGETHRFTLSLQLTEWELLSIARIQNFETMSNIINFCNNMHRLTIVDLSTEDCANVALQILMEGNNLKEFSLINAQQSFDDLLCGVVAYCPNITKFSCANSLFVKQESVITICRHCKHLTELNVENCVNMSDHLIFCCAVNCQNLTSLNIKGCNGIKKNELMILAYYSRKLLVSFQTTADISDLTLELMTNNWGTTLEILEIESQHDEIYFMNKRSVYVTDRSVIKMTATLLPRLTWLSLENNQKLSHISLASIADHLLKLEYLNIKEVRCYFGGALNRVSEKLVKLKKLDISDVMGRKWPASGKITYASPLLRSIETGYSSQKLSFYLITRCVNVNVFDEVSFDSALMIAQKNTGVFESGVPELFELLIKFGADVNHRNFNGDTALLNAVKLGHLEQVQLLIAAKADLEIKNKDGFTALQFAKQHYSINSKRIIAELVRAGADTSPPEGYIDSEIHIIE